MQIVSTPLMQVVSTHDLKTGDTIQFYGSFFKLENRQTWPFPIERNALALSFRVVARAHRIAA